MSETTTANQDERETVLVAIQQAERWVFPKKYVELTRIASASGISDSGFAVHAALRTRLDAAFAERVGS